MPENEKKDWESLPLEKQFEWEERVRYLIKRGYLPSSTDVERQAAKMYQGKSDV